MPAVHDGLPGNGGRNDAKRAGRHEWRGAAGVMIASRPVAQLICVNGKIGIEWVRRRLPQARR
ncbi:hypothetical protein WI27_10905 [Burkholderia cepacia]|nr:hypothetical protein WI27_10905 [Burkholderia cepacia]